MKNPKLIEHSYCKNVMLEIHSGILYSHISLQHPTLLLAKTDIDKMHQTNG